MIPEDEVLRIYRATIRPLYAYVYRRTRGDASLTEDLVQETWMRALDAWPTRGVPEDPQAWLSRVAHNTLISHFRKHRPDLADPAWLDVADDRQSVEATNVSLHVEQGLNRLGQSQAAMVEAFHLDGQSVAHIAATHDMTPRAVEGRLRRARVRLKALLTGTAAPARRP